MGWPRGTSYDGVTALGDEDLWTFTGYEGSPFSITCTNLTGGSYYAWVRLYNSSGALLANINPQIIGTINYTPTNHDTFTLIVGSYFQGYTGSYRLVATNISDGLKLVSPAFNGPSLNLTAAGGGSNVQAVLYLDDEPESTRRPIAADPDQSLRRARRLYLHESLQPVEPRAILPSERAVRCSCRGNEADDLAFSGVSASSRRQLRIHDRFAFAISTANTCIGPYMFDLNTTHFLSGVIVTFGSTPPSPVT